MAKPMWILKTKELTKKFGNLIAVDNINLEIKQGTIHGFLGINGAGKTTTLRLLAGILEPTKGDIEIFGLPLDQKNLVHIKQKMGYVPGETNLYEYYTVKQFLEFVEALRNIKNGSLKEELLELFKVDTTKKIKALSRGNKQKVLLIQALMHDPDLLILDEPTSGLDPINRKQFFDYLLELKKRNKTVFFSTHVLPEAKRVCDEISIIKYGKIVAQTEVKSLSEVEIEEYFMKYYKN